MNDVNEYLKCYLRNCSNKIIISDYWYGKSIKFLSGNRENVNENVLLFHIKIIYLFLMQSEKGKDYCLPVLKKNDV